MRPGLISFMKAIDAQNITEAAIRLEQNDTDCKMKAALELIYQGIKKAGEKRRWFTMIKYNGSKQSPNMLHWLGECVMIGWDGGERTYDTNECIAIKQLLKDDGFKVENVWQGLQISWAAPDASTQQGP